MNPVRKRFAAIAVGAVLLSMGQALTPVAAPAAPKANVELPDPRSAPAKPVDRPMPDSGPPGPPAQAPPDLSLEEEEKVKSPPVRTNKLVKKSPSEVGDFERKHKAKVVENQDDLFVYDTVVDGKTERVALLAKQTKSGFPVIGMAFLDEAEIKAVEKAKKETKHTSLLGPGVAHAHFTDYGHYHDFFQCSFVYQYPNTWEVYLYVCPTDVSSARAVGGSAAAAIGIATGHPWLGWAVGMGINAGMWRIQEADGSIHIYFTHESISRASGWTYFWGTFNDWFRGFPYGAAYGAYGWAQKWLDGSWWRIDFCVWC